MLRVENLNYSIGQKPILTDINLCMKPGQKIAIIGPNGSGKTTLLALLAGLIQPSHPAIFLHDRPLGHYRRKDLAQIIALVAQQSDTTMAVEALQVVEMGRMAYRPLMALWTKHDKDVIEAAFKQVEMSGFEQRNWHSLSGGEKQRLHIARALAQQGELLILDEPTNHLDIRFQLELLALIKNQPVAVIAALHDLNHAAMFCDTLIIMKDGKIFAFGAPQDILTPDSIQDVYGVKAEVEQHKTFVHVKYCL